MRIRPWLFKRERLREVTGFSVFILIIDLANKLNYSTDTIVIGAFMGGRRRGVGGGPTIDRDRPAHHGSAQRGSFSGGRRQFDR